MRVRSVRLHLDNHRESSRTSTSTTESVASSWTDGEPPAPPLLLSIALRDLVAEAEALHDRLDFATFVDLAESPRLPYLRDGQSQWKRVEKASTFTLLKRDDEVLALARLDASVEEVASILAATTDPLHAAAMKGLYGDAFIAGTVAYVLRPQTYEDIQVHQHLAVKTTSFVHSDMLGKNEQWCFAENFRCNPEGDSFTLTQGSLSATQAHTLPARSVLKDDTRRVAQLRGVTAAYLVERLPGSHGIRVVFHAAYQLDSIDPSPTASQNLLIKGPSSSSLSSTKSDLSTLSTVSSDSSSSSQMLAELLGQVVESDSDDVTSGRRRAALTVLNQLLTADQEEAQVQADENKKILSAVIASSPPKEAAHKALDISAFPEDPAECKFASAESRPYPMIPAVVPSDSNLNTPPEPIIYPIPANEDIRLAAIEHFKLHDILNVPELNVICTLAAAEMGCPHSVITLVECEVVTLLATNDPENWDLGSGNPREQTFCQHFVMDDQPLLVRHAEADMRFYHIAPVTMRSLRFYAGFPVSVSSVSKSGNPGEPDKVVVGALCCLDAKPHQMTRSQYWRLMKLADAASSILERSAKEYIADPKNYSRGQNGVGTQTAAKTNATGAVAC
ncbi:UDP-glucuronic acid decarboxylase 1 [Phytophthora cinnamomi]|uniref:UDP-glucuronic acid decarboxylase 1 n=1 Tax=Phytophthora cinnamomi TaxID=4785 RepID=UPI003559854E|nr:UDP-glucuronic acid decarboxylase 1 [Phytophthora cinnamomi]